MEIKVNVILELNILKKRKFAVIQLNGNYISKINFTRYAIGYSEVVFFNTDDKIVTTVCDCNVHELDI